jgi:transposase
LYAIKSFRENGKNTSKIVEKLGTLAELSEVHADSIAWAKAYIDELNRKENEEKRNVLVEYAPAKRIPFERQRSFHGGYLFLQKIYHELELDKICKEISEKYKFIFDLNAILSRLVYSRILFPTSKLATCRLVENYLEPPQFELQHVYRALEVLAKESDFIQAELYRSSMKDSKRNTGVLYYDCTNYFFEIEQEEGLKQYGQSKEHRPNPIVQMGLFMDGDGVPLAFSVQAGNTNEQVTWKPLEQKILSEFALSKFVVCTDAGLASIDNRKFNDMGERAFVTTQSIKKLKKHLKDWALGKTGWRLAGKTETYDISQLDEDKHRKDTFYKERWINDDGLEQRLIVTYSIKYREYQRNIRKGQIDRAQKVMDTNPQKLIKVNQNDYRRFIRKTQRTADGEVAEMKLYHIDTTLIRPEEAYDGFYGVCTNLEDDASAILKINHQRWEIEESFRIMKSEFKARPVYTP